MKGKRGFVLAVTLQVLVLLLMAGRHVYTLQVGQPIVLETVPVDPWEMFRGEYVRLAFEISRLQEDRVVMSGRPYRTGQQVWVTLEQGSPFWKATAISATRPPASPGSVVVRGTVRWANIPFVDPGRPIKAAYEVSVNYGIEQFFVPEGQGRDLERNQTGLTVEARVDPFGRAALSRVFLHGKEIRWQ